jgi:acetylglutamate kinase
MTVQALQAKAQVLIEALPYIRRFAGETLVVKYGGHAMTDPDAAMSFAQDVTLLNSVGLRVVVVHGGGPQIQAMLDKVGIES